MMVRYVVLGLLRGGAVLHGYGLMKEYRRRSALQAGSGRFYRELQRLAGEGLVRTVANPADADPRRVPYQITRAGTAEFDAWLSSVRLGLDACVDDGLCARAALLGGAPPGLVHGTLSRWHEELWMRGTRIEEAYQRALEKAGAVCVDGFDPLPLVLARRLKHAAADLEFLDELRTAYEKSVSRSGARPAQAAPRRSGRGTS